MLRLDSISLVHFRNYVRQEFSFSRRITALCGMNGTGKTNFLDAVYYLGFTRSYFTRPDQQSVHRGLQGMRIQGHYTLQSESHEVTCIFRETNKKEFTVDGRDYKRFSEHIGKFPCVMIAPDDVELVSGGSEERRKFIDTILAQCLPGYLAWLIDYTRVLQQRNSLLKAAAREPLDEMLLDTLDEQLSEKGGLLFEARKKFLEAFLPKAIAAYRRIAQQDDGLSLQYTSHLHTEPLAALLRAGRKTDLVLQRTGCGIHKDDLELRMHGQLFKNIASQGQRKSLLFALKLAEFETLQQEKGFAPILLLDDVFEKLDPERMRHLLKKVCLETQAQVFITDTHPERLQEQLQAITADFELLNLKNI